MTIAVGIPGPGFVVIAADSEESLSDYRKAPTNKLSVSMWALCQDPTCGLMITGSGGSNYLEYLKSEIKSMFSPDCDIASVDSFEIELRKVMRSFFKDHYLPFKGTPYNEALEPSLIIAASFGFVSNEIGLLTTYRSTVTRHKVSEAVTVGGGYIQATNVIRNLGPIYDVSSASAAAVLAVLMAKKFESGCGAETQMAVLDHKNEIRDANPEAIREAESAFEDYLELDADIRNWILGTPWDEPLRSDALEIKMRAERIRDSLLTIRFYGPI